MKMTQQIVPIIRGLVWQFPMQLRKDFDSAPSVGAQIFTPKAPHQKLFELQSSDNSITVAASPDNAKHFIFTFTLKALQTATISDDEVLMEVVLLGNNPQFITRGRLPVWAINYQF
jgi:hypothetical protein